MSAPPSPRTGRTFSGFGRSAALLVALLGSMGLAGCEGETLYGGDDPVGPTGPAVLAPHSVALVGASIPARMEARDEMVFTVRAKSTQGDLTAIGIAARVVGARLATPALVRLVEIPVPAGQLDVTRELRVTLAQVRALLPTPTPATEELSLDVSAYAVHASGSCVAAIENTLQQLPCTLVNGVSVGSGGGGAVRTVLAVAGSTVALPNSVEQVGDVVVHNPTAQVFLSNRASNTVEVLQLNATGGPAFRPNPILVGSQPWGMNLNRGGDTLIVANSGGVSFSFVSVSSGQERRYEIPRTTLHNLSFTVDTITGSIVCLPNWKNYTDRPQYVAQDRDGRLLYSVASSAASPVGTIRMARVPSTGTELSSSFLFPGLVQGVPLTSPILLRGVIPARPPAAGIGYLDFAVANLDSITLNTVVSPPYLAPTCSVTLYDHIPGTSPRQRIIAGPAPFSNLASGFEDISSRGSDIAVVPGYLWNLDAAIQASDTTFVAASGNRQLVAFGEGVTQSAGRVTLWNSQETLSRSDDVKDLTNNTSDRITAVDLNSDGTIGMARGLAGTYFFDQNLRLRGTAATGLQGGSGGALLTLSTGRTLAFLGTNRNSIQIVETTNYRPVLEIPIRDNIIGPLKVAPGRQAGIGATVYAVTAEGVVVLDIPLAQIQ